jgi:hypothetical protein
MRDVPSEVRLSWEIVGEGFGEFGEFDASH